MKIKSDQIASQITSDLSRLNDSVVKRINEAIDKVVTNTKKDIQNQSPKRSKKYSKGWKITKTKGERGIVVSEVHNPKGYRLSHLLEKGHQLRNGKRSKAFPHFIKNEAEAIKAVESEVDRILDEL